MVGWNWALHQSALTEQVALLRRFPYSFWLGAALVTLITISIFTEPFGGLRRWLKQAFDSDTKMFFMVIGLTSIAIFLLVHMDILAKGMLLLSAISLARFDFQLAKCRHWAAFIYLSLVALLGLFSGAWLHWAWTYYDLPWLLAH